MSLRAERERSTGGIQARGLTEGVSYFRFGIYPALEDWRIPAGIGPTSVVRERLLPNGSRSLGIDARASDDLDLQAARTRMLKNGHALPHRDREVSPTKNTLRWVGGTSLSRYSTSRGTGPRATRWARCLLVGGTSLSRYAQQQTHRDREVSPTGKPSRPGGLSYQERIETGRARRQFPIFHRSAISFR